MTHKCKNPDCKYGTTLFTDDALYEVTTAEAYDQDPARWKEGKPSYFGLCLNCIDDDQQDRAMLADIMDGGWVEDWNENC